MLFPHKNTYVTPDPNTHINSHLPKGPIVKTCGFVMKGSRPFKVNFGIKKVMGSSNNTMSLMDIFLSFP